MRLNALIQADGAYINGVLDLINNSPVTGVADYSLFYNQITLEFFDNVIELDNGLKVPDPASVVVTGLAGNITFAAKPSQYSPYNVVLPNNGILNVANTNILQWTGIADIIEIISSTVSGANYINILIDRA